MKMAQLENSLLKVSTEKDEDNQPQQQTSTSTQDESLQQKLLSTAKKKRNQPGMPDPNAEVVALSPNALLATNRFICEVCGKGFQRDQNLQLHRRGHNLPWKLRQRSPKDPIKKRVYVCPEPTCVHHDPHRALGDLTGIKKHFCRKHGDKKWECDRCSKKYAVRSDYKAHLKTCGTREYKCDCGTIFSRRDSFLTHRAFCDALAQESAKVHNVSGGSLQPTSAVGAAATTTMSSAVASPTLSINQSSDIQENGVRVATSVSSASCSTSSTSTPKDNDNGNDNVNGNNLVSFQGSMFAPLSPFSQQSSFPGLLTTMPLNQDPPSTYTMIEPPPILSLSPLYQFSRTNGASASSLLHDHDNYYTSPPQPTMSATALLQKAAQLGAAASVGSSQFCGFGSMQSRHEVDKNGVKIENDGVVADTLGLGLPSAGRFNGSDSPMMDYPPGFFGSKPMTLDLLGLGNSSTAAFPAAYLTPIGGQINVAMAAFNDDPAAQETTDSTAL